MVRRLALIAALAAVVLGASSAAGEEPPLAVKQPTGYRDYCGQTRTCPRGGVPAGLWRPLRLPTLGPSVPCPVSAGHDHPPWTRALGSGRIYVTFGNHDRLEFRDPPYPFFAGTGWNGAKAGWISAKAYRGPVVIRGARIDAPGELAFYGHTKSRRPVAALQFAPQAMKPNGSGTQGGYRWWGGYVALKAAGCYAVQIDGSSFSTILVFRADRVNAASR